MAVYDVSVAMERAAAGSFPSTVFGALLRSTHRHPYGVFGADAGSAGKVAGRNPLDWAALDAERYGDTRRSLSQMQRLAQWRT